MTEKQCHEEEHSKGFSMGEKIFMGIGIYCSVLIGAYGISLESVSWSILYLVFVLLGMVVLFGYGLCSHCPYIFEEYSDCLFPPWGRIYRKLYKYRGAKLTATDKGFFFGVMLGIPLIPQYWLVHNLSILILFWLFFLPTAGGFLFYECRKCKHLGCPINRAAEKA